jgi:hypothetical protein
MPCGIAASEIKEVTMDNIWKADRIKTELEALILEAFLSVLDKIVQQFIEAKKIKEGKF